MHLSILASLLLTCSATATIIDVLSPRQSPNITEDYLRDVCRPPTLDPIPPCQSVINIQTACEPNSTTPLAYEAHAQCMCSGSFFSDWEGCLACQTVHGARSPRVAEVFLTIISSASTILCTGTPTAAFAAIFSGLSASGAEEGGGNTLASDRFPGETAVSLYYTDTRSQRPGAITGSATAATATGPTREVESTTTSSQSRATGSLAGTGSGTGIVASVAPTSTSTGGSAPTGATWMEALWFVAGGVAMAAL